MTYHLDLAYPNEYLQCKNEYCPCAHCNVAWNSCGGKVLDDPDPDGPQMQRALQVNPQVAEWVQQRLEQAYSSMETGMETGKTVARPPAANCVGVSDSQTTQTNTTQIKENAGPNCTPVQKRQRIEDQKPAPPAVTHRVANFHEPDADGTIATVRKDLAGALQEFDVEHESLASSPGSENGSDQGLPFWDGYDNMQGTPHSTHITPLLWKPVRVDHTTRITAFAIPMQNIQELKNSCFVRMQKSPLSPSAETGDVDRVKLHALHLGVLHEADSLFEVSGCLVEEHDISMKHRRVKTLCRVFDCASMLRLYEATMSKYIEKDVDHRFTFQSTWMKFILNIGETPLKRILRDFQIKKHTVQCNNTRRQ